MSLSFIIVDIPDLLESDRFLPSHLPSISPFGCAQSMPSKHLQSFRDRRAKITTAHHILRDLRLAPGVILFGESYSAWVQPNSMPSWPTYQGPTR